jgi:N-acetylmuramoyl-L-alanine amidase
VTRAIRAGALLAFGLLIALPATGATAREMYASASARARTLRESASREGTDSPSVKDYRAAAAAFEAIVRRYPTTGYVDNALLEASSLAREAFERFGHEQDKTSALRLLNWLVNEYPASPLVSKARDDLKRWATLPARAAVRAPSTARPVVVAAAAAPAPAGPDTAKIGTAPDDGADAAPTPPDQAMLREIRRAVIGDIVRVTIELDSEVTYKVERVDSPARVFFDLDATRLGSTVSEGTTSFPGDAVRHIRIGRRPNRVLRVVLDLGGVKRYSVFTLYGPYRIVVDCERGPALPPVPTMSIAEEKVRAPVGDPEGTSAQPDAALSKTEPVLSKADRPVTRAGTAPVRTDTPAAKTEPAPARAEAAPTRNEAPSRAPAATKPLSGRSLAVAARTVAPAVLRPSAVLAPASSEPAVLLPLKVTRQFRSTRYPTWAPVVTPPGAAWIEALSAAAAVAPPAGGATPVAERATASADRSAITNDPVTPPPSGFSMARQLGLGATRIVIDPGHGGHDPGAEGSGVLEAEIVLDVALRLEKLLNAAGIEAVLTRRKDEYVPLEERTAIANRAQGDLFLSIHANASRNRAARGIESFVLNFATTPDAEAVAARENASTGLTMSSLTEIVKAITLNNKLDESRTFAGIIQRELETHLGGSNKELRNHGVKQAPFVVLIGASMPSVLAEISFITNVQEGRLLKTGPYRQKIAEGLFDAIRGYQKSLKGAAVLTRQ